jgi:hypothetical protein
MKNLQHTTPGMDQLYFTPSHRGRTRARASNSLGVQQWRLYTEIALQARFLMESF